MPTERKFFRHFASLLVVAAAPVLLLTGCLDTHHEAPVAANQCTACHGDAERAVASDAGVLQAAPPFDLNGNSQTSARGVGAHQNHLTESATHDRIECTECHQVPNKVFSPGHLDNRGSARITFGARAHTKDSQPSYDPKTQTCTNTYCHGNGVFNWRSPRDSAGACGNSCHTLPPPAPHPQNSECFRCHGPVIDKNRNFIAKNLHIDGIVETGDLACNSCHGSNSSGGPPPDLEGNTESRYPGVGAHANHLQASATHAPVACNQCHIVPTSVDSPGHIDSARPADITFGALASDNGKSSPAYDESTNSCSSTYCHGSYSPQWTAPRDSTTACGSCHGLPPPAPHPQKAECYQCHTQVIDANGNFLDPALHVDGLVEVSPSCGSCHGDPNRAGDKLTQAAPPSDLAGSSDVTLPGVGAHQRHLQASATHGAVSCDQCHIVPSAWNSAGHDVTGAPPAKITFGSFEQNNNLTAVYSFTDHTCSNTYCHAYYSLANYMPNWVAQSDPAQTCGTCHSLPPPFVPNANPPISARSHPKITDCSRCHGAVIDSNRNFTAPGRHVDGNIDVVTPLACNSCHGSSASAAPPTDLAGNTSVTSIGVGAHQTHVTGGQLSRPVPCSDCHITPKNVNDPGHIDDWTIAEINFAGAATKGGHVPTWNRLTASCTDSWCHGPVTAGNTSPVWTDPSVALTCTNCHGLPPPDPHPQVAQNPLVAQCWICHTNITQGFGFVNRNLHVNGNVDF
jgi:predicted CxxxxCH...CXXCH cytochrome family protein